MTGKVHYLSLLFALCNCENMVTEMTEMTHMRHLRLTDDSAGIAMFTSSVLRCAVQCNSSCVSLSYHGGTKSCRLYNVLLSNDASTAENGWKSYRKITSHCPTDLGYVYVDTLGWCYRLVIGLNMNIPSATDFCEADGAHLIRISSTERQQHITDFLLANGISSVYIGGRSENKDNNFAYEDGTPLSFTAWDTSQPVSQTSIYIELKDSSYVWANGHGTMSRDFMCEI
ncbi:uncharacterized protein LOC117318158 [Pecten maximus]|uniref:uncharacterized protein LOC117318158 n=1 Tax=Pecten maximus TaxID=6579 RepID=UPI0014585269|nr:uncharacterized protein LOC117318158 [Pecten maximus]